MRQLVSVALVVATASGSGCSFTFQRHLPDGIVRESLATKDCSTSRTLPWIDTGFVAAGVLTGIAGFAMHQGVVFDRREDAGTVLSGVALFVAMFNLASAGAGFERAAACVAASGAAPQPGVARTREKETAPPSVRRPR